MANMTEMVREKKNMGNELYKILKKKWRGTSLHGLQDLIEKK